MADRISAAAQLRNPGDETGALLGAECQAILELRLERGTVRQILLIGALDVGVALVLREVRRFISQLRDNAPPAAPP